MLFIIAQIKYSSFSNIEPWQDIYTSNCISNASHSSYCFISAIFRIDSWMPAKYSHFKLISPKVACSHCSPYSPLPEWGNILDFSKQRVSIFILLTTVALRGTTRRCFMLCPSLRLEEAQSWTSPDTNSSKKLVKNPKSFISHIISHFYTSRVTHTLREYLRHHPDFACLLCISLYAWGHENPSGN